MNDNKNIAIIITTYNRKEELSKTLSELESLKYSYGDKYIIVVNDGSKDGTIELLSTNFPNVIQINGTGNWWFTRSLNEGIKKALELSCYGVVTLNDDCRISPDYLNKCIEITIERVNYIVAPVIIFENEPTIVQECGSYVKWFPYYSSKPAYKKTLLESLPNEFIINTIGGRGLFIQRYIFDRIGLYDNNSFIQYGSDDDFIMRAKKYGINTIVNKSLIVFGEKNIFNPQSNKIGAYYKDLFNNKSKISIFNSITLIYRYADWYLKLFSIIGTILVKLLIPFHRIIKCK